MKMEAQLGNARKGMLYPLMVIAAIAVTVFSMIGIATMTGLFSTAQSRSYPLEEVSRNNEVTGASESGQAARKGAPAPTARPVPVGSAAAPVNCRDCGVVESVRTTQVKGQGTGIGAVAGGVGGALVGSQFGKGSGRTVATVVGAAGGAYAGHEIEKNVRASAVYVVQVRMQDGSVRTISQARAPGVAAGEQVRIVDGAVVPRS